MFLNTCDSFYLLRVCYDRAPKHSLALTFLLSALWHGVYPGYYFTFVTAIPITMAARAVSIVLPLYNCNLAILTALFAFQSLIITNSSSSSY